MILSAGEEEKDTLTNIEAEKILSDVQNQINDIKYAHVKEEIVRDEELVSAGNIVEINNIFENSLVKKETFNHLNSVLERLHETVRQKKNLFEMEENIDEAEDGTIDNIGSFLDIEEKNKEAKKNIDSLKKFREEGVLSKPAYDKLSEKISNTPEGQVIGKVETVFDKFKNNELSNAGKGLLFTDSSELETVLEEIKKPKIEEKEVEEEKEPEEEEVEEVKKDEDGFLKKLRGKFSKIKPPAFVSKIVDKIPFIKHKKKEVEETESSGNKDEEKEEYDNILKLPDLRRKTMNLKLFVKKKVLKKIKIDSQMTNAVFKEHVNSARIDENLRDEINVYFGDYGISEYMGHFSQTEEGIKKLEKDTKAFLRKLDSY